MATRKWVRNSALIDRVLQLQPRQLDNGDLQVSPNSTPSELQSIAINAGRTAWRRRDDSARLEALARSLQAQAGFVPAGDRGVTSSAYARAMCATIEATITREGSPWLLERMLGERIEYILGTRGAAPSVVDAELTGAFLRPLLVAGEGEELRVRRSFRASIATLFSAVMRLDAAALRGDLPDLNSIPAYRELQALLDVLNGVLMEVPIHAGAAATPELTAVT